MIKYELPTECDNCRKNNECPLRDLAYAILILNSDPLQATFKSLITNYQARDQLRSKCIDYDAQYATFIYSSRVRFGKCYANFWIE